MKNRYYAIILGADGRDLAKSLVEAGLARAFGVSPDHDAPKVSAHYREELECAESKARVEHAGVWSKPGDSSTATPSISKSKLPSCNFLKVITTRTCRRQSGDHRRQ